MLVTSSDKSMHLCVRQSCSPYPGQYPVGSGRRRKSLGPVMPYYLTTGKVPFNPPTTTCPASKQKLLPWITFPGRVPSFDLHTHTRFLSNEDTILFCLPHIARFFTVYVIKITSNYNLIT